MANEKAQFNVSRWRLVSKLDCVLSVSGYFLNCFCKSKNIFLLRSARLVFGNPINDQKACLDSLAYLMENIGLSELTIILFKNHDSDIPSSDCLSSRVAFYQKLPHYQ